jgi:hypothetical protein
MGAVTIAAAHTGAEDSSGAVDVAAAYAAALEAVFTFRLA